MEGQWCRAGRAGGSFGFVLTLLGCGRAPSPSLGQPGGFPVPGKGISSGDRGVLHALGAPGGAEGQQGMGFGIAGNGNGDGVIGTG